MLPASKLDSTNELVASEELGSVATNELGEMYRYVKTKDALSRGQIVKQSGYTSGLSNEDTLSSNLATGSTWHKRIVTQSGAAWTAGFWNGCYLYINDGTGEGQLRRIVKNNSTELYLDAALDTALAVADSDGIIFSPWQVELSPITTLLQKVLGVAVCTVTAGNYTWIKCQGLAEVKAGEAMTAGEPCSPGDDTTGSVKKYANGETPDDVYNVGTVALANANADKGVPVYLDCL